MYWVKDPTFCTVKRKNSPSHAAEATPKGASPLPNIDSWQN